jgi:hypothetical protein
MFIYININGPTVGSYMAVEIEGLFQKLVYHRHHILLGVQPGFGLKDER